ncbi:MAG: preprotein translocase subunit SecG [Candidatus Omnitrophica bacterium]|nr:preprotein translocase subunit SecG [Candidatus Omnitrophota bacterium]
MVLVVHVLLAVFMIIIILLQGGRGGLGEALGGAAAQSLFGGGANIVMTKLTAFCAGLFMITSLTLALLSSKEGGSIIDRLPAAPEAAIPLTLPDSSSSAASTAPAPTTP